MAKSKSPRMTVSFTRPQMDYLQAESNRLGVSVADLIRRIIDAHRDKANDQQTA